MFDATRTADGVRVAIKVLSAPLGTGSDARRIWREVDLLAETRHPSFPRVLDQGVLDDGRPFIVFEFISGTTLDAYARARELDQRERAELVARVAESVQVLHDRGIIHRDLKPSNILIDVHREPVIIDLGVAALLDRTGMETLTADGTPLGTPAFMAPEQARGARAEVTIRSDVYSLGATAFLLLTGATPHDMNTTLHEAIRRVAFDPPRRARALDPALDPALAAVVQKAIAPEPAKRYGTASEFAADLRRWLRGEPVEAKPPGPWQRATRWVSRHPIGAVTAAALVLGTLIIGLSVLGSWWLGTRPYRVQWDGVEKTPARLFSRSGNVLRAWPDKVVNEAGAVLAGAAERPGRSNVAVVAESYGCSGRYAGLLCAYSFDSYESDPVWVRGVGGVDISKPEHIQGSPPEDDAGAEPGHFVTGVGLVADIFEDVPGDEIVATHYPNPWSATAIRIYSCDGDILYEAWHDGRFNGMHWFEDERVLLLAGVNSERRFEHLRNGRGNHVPVIMAIEPCVGTTDRLITESACPDRFRPRWYKTIVPEAAMHLRVDRVTRAVEPELRDRAVCVDLVSMADDAADSINPRSVSVYLSADGRLELIRVGDPFRKDPPFDLDQQGQPGFLRPIGEVELAPRSSKD